MLSKYSNRFIVLLVLILFTFACDTSPQKSKVKESPAPSLTTTVGVTGGTIEGVEQDGIFSYK